jgi:hypothetical protein
MKYLWNFLIGVLAFLACFAIDKWILPRSVFHKSEGIDYLRQVNQSLLSSNTALNNASKQLVRHMENDLADPIVAEQMKLLLPKALYASTLSDSVYRLVEHNKNMLATEAAKYSYPATSNRSAERLFVKGGEGDKLYAVLEQYTRKVLLIDAGVDKAFSQTLPALRSIKAPGKNKSESWAKETFDNKTTLQAEIILNRIMNDIAVSENMVLNHLYGRPSRSPVAYDK